MIIRGEHRDDHAAVAEVHPLAFADPSVPEAFLVRPLSAYNPRYRGRVVYPPAFGEEEA